MESCYRVSQTEHSGIANERLREIFSFQYACEMEHPKSCTQSTTHGTARQIPGSTVHGHGISHLTRHFKTELVFGAYNSPDDTTSAGYINYVEPSPSCDSSCYDRAHKSLSKKHHTPFVSSGGLGETPQQQQFQNYWPMYNHAP